MTRRWRWYDAVLGSAALVVMEIAFGLVLEHGAGPSWAGNGGPKTLRALPHHALHASSQRIPEAVRQRLANGSRLGGRYGGLDLHNLGNLRHAVLIELLIAGLTVAAGVAARRYRRRMRSRA